MENFYDSISYKKTKNQPKTKVTPLKKDVAADFNPYDLFAAASSHQAGSRVFRKKIQRQVCNTKCRICCKCACRG